MIGYVVQVLIFLGTKLFETSSIVNTQQLTLVFLKICLESQFGYFEKKNVWISFLACNVLSSTFLVTRANLIPTWAVSTSLSSKTPCAPSSRASGTGRACSTSTKAHLTMQSRLSGRKLALDVVLLGYRKWISPRNLRCSYWSIREFWAYFSRTLLFHDFNSYVKLRQISHIGSGLLCFTIQSN